MPGSAERLATHAFLLPRLPYDSMPAVSTTSPASTSAAAPIYELRRQPPKPKLPVVRLALTILLLAIASLFEPHCFRFAVRQSIFLEAWRCGVRAQIRVVEGSLFESVRVLDSVWIYESENGPVTRLEIKELEADLAWRSLFTRGSSGWFRQLTVDGMTGKVQLPIDTPATAPVRNFFTFELPRPRSRWLPGPERIEARNADFIFESDGDYVRLQNARFTISEMEAGELLVGNLIIKQPWLNRTFRNVTGTTKLDNARTELGAILLEPGVSIQNLSVELAEIARGRLNLEMQVAAFGGAIRIETQTLPRGRQLAFEATGTFSQIAIGSLATFLGQSDAAGGTIKEGKFTFRGSPQSPAKANASLRLVATNFQWESRQWDSLVLGASLFNGRVQIPELTLHQAHNFLNVRGEFALPAAQEAWWQNEFAFDVNAKIENLTELSALVLPEFKYAAGKGTIDGSVRGDHQQFHGQIIVSGSNLTWRNAPIEELHATLKLNGNELQLANLSLFNQGDFVRGKGVVNILGDKQYWGDLHASIEDLARYAALLQKPIVPEPIAGGAVVDWTGEGSARGHTGKFFARLAKLRSLGATSTLLHPINADFDGTYQPGAILFSRFALSDDLSSFTANVSVVEKAVRLQGIRFIHGPALQLEGDAVLPLDVWQSWSDANAAKLLSDATPSRVHLVANDLDLRAASLLTGWNFPIAGIVRGEVNAEGPIGALATSGNVSLTEGRLPLGWSGLVLDEASGEGSLAGQTFTIGKLAGKLPTADVQLQGAVDFTKIRDPQLKVAVTTSRAAWQLFPGIPNRILASGKMQATIDGPFRSASVAGTVDLAGLEVSSPINLAPLVLGAALKAPPFVRIPAGVWNGWRLDLAARSPQGIALNLPGATTTIETRITGTIGDPVISGHVALAGASATIGPRTVSITQADFDFDARSPRDPSIALRATGSVYEAPFAVHAAGPLSHLVRFFEVTQPLSEELLRADFAGASPAPAFTLLAPIAQAAAIDVFAWAPFDDANPASPAPAQ